jgi:hypothetical protein
MFTKYFEYCDDDDVLYIQPNKQGMQTYNLNGNMMTMIAIDDRLFYEIPDAFVIEEINGKIVLYDYNKYTSRNSDRFKVSYSSFLNIFSGVLPQKILSSADITLLVNEITLQECRFMTITKPDAVRMLLDLIVGLMLYVRIDGVIKKMYDRPHKTWYNKAQKYCYQIKNIFDFYPEAIVMTDLCAEYMRRRKQKTTMDTKDIALMKERLKNWCNEVRICFKCET